MHQTGTRNRVVRVFMIIFGFLGAGLLACCILMIWVVQRQQTVSKVVSPDVRSLVSDIHLETMNAWRSCVHYLRSGRPAELASFNHWRRQLVLRQSQLTSTWLVDGTSKTTVHQLISLQNQIRREGAMLIERANIGERMSYADTSKIRTLGFDFSDVSSRLNEQASIQIQGAQEKLVSLGQGVNLLIGIMTGITFLLSFVIPITVKKSFDLYVQAREISAKKIAESEQRFRQIFEHEPQCVKLINREGRLLDMNPAGLRMIEAPSLSAVVGTDVMEFVVPEHRQRFKAAVAKLLQDGSEQHLEFQIRGLKGTKRLMESFNVPFWHESGAHVTGILSITYDITEKRDREVELRELKETMIHVARVNMMGELASSMAHELNQPLTAVVNFAYLLEAEAEVLDKPNLRKLASLVQEESLRASQIVAGLRRLVDRQAVEAVPESIKTIVDDSAKLLMEEFKQLQIDFLCDVSAELPPVPCDKIQIQQVLYNLMRNAVDCIRANNTRERRIQVHASLLDDECVAIQVEDSGPGIPENELDSIFKPFFSRKDKGLGMGLCISQSIAEAHGGRLKVDSVPGAGSCFTLILPLKPISDLASCRIEDSLPDSRSVISVNERS